MERLQAPTDSCLLDEHLAAMECLQHGLLNSGRLRFGDELEQEVLFSETAMEDKIPFLQMLQCVEPSTFLPFKEPNIFHSLLQIQTLEPESCLTHETTATDHDHPFNLGSISSSPPPPPPVATFRNGPETDPKSEMGSVRERRKRKRTRAPKNKEEVESQRMTHIAVERNRRRQMNEHLNSLRSLMPPSYLQRGDQASVIGGAIDFIKELEQLLHSLDAQKGIKTGDGNDEPEKKIHSPACNSLPSSVSTSEDGLKTRAAAAADGGAEAAEIEATVMQNHVNLKVRCKRQRGQILRAIVSLEELRLTILHLNITSSLDFVFYSFNLKIEEDCKLGSADEITVAVHQIFKHINGG